MDELETTEALWKCDTEHQADAKITSYIELVGTEANLLKNLYGPLRRV